jgi:predicted nucleic acid binding AN1-type Zn finger protein
MKYENTLVSDSSLPDNTISTSQMMRITSESSIPFRENTTVRISSKKVKSQNENQIMCHKYLKNSICKAMYIKNIPVTLMAVPDMGYTLESWGDDCTGKKSYVILSMNEDKEYKCSAHFKKVSLPKE